MINYVLKVGADSVTNGEITGNRHLDLEGSLEAIFEIFS